MASTLLVGLVDFLIGHEISVASFYLLGVAVATWWIDARAGVLVAVFSLVIGAVGDAASGKSFSSPLVLVWNGSVLLFFYLVVVWLLGRLRGFYLHLEARVRERTLALTEEMAERERLEHEVLEISEREQRRIGEDLHDGLCQHLMAATLASKVLEEKLAVRELGEAEDAAKVVGLVASGIDLCRQLAKGLYPVEVGADGLMLALAEYAESASRLFLVDCRFACDSPVLVHDAFSARHLYRIAQEAVGNAIKHGRARKIVIRLEADEETSFLQVEDDGCGLPEELPVRRGLGLRIMAHRASMIGATFSARARPEGGTLARCVWPFEPPSANESSRG